MLLLDKINHCVVPLWTGWIGRILEKRSYIRMDTYAVRTNGAEANVGVPRT